MKMFIIINGFKSYLIEKETLQAAKDYAINFMDHSNETIVREVKEFYDIIELFKDL
jgi:hypothetical protein